MEAREKMRVVSGAIILLTLGVLVFLSTQGIWSIDKSWPILIIVFAAVTLVQSPRDLGGWVIGAAGLLFLFFKNWFGQISDMSMNLLTSAILIAGAYLLFKSMKKKES